MGAGTRPAAKPATATKASASKPRTKRPAKPATTPRGNPARSAPQPPVDPETDPELLAFLQAVDRYKRERSRPFPSYSELLTILKGLGWRRIDDDAS